MSQRIFIRGLVCPSSVCWSIGLSFRPSVCWSGISQISQKWTCDDKTSGNPYNCILSFMHSFIYSFIHSFIHSFECIIVWLKLVSVTNQRLNNLLSPSDCPFTLHENTFSQKDIVCSSVCPFPPRGNPARP